MSVQSTNATTINSDVDVLNRLPTNTEGEGQNPSVLSKVGNVFTTAKNGVVNAATTVKNGVVTAAKATGANFGDVDQNLQNQKAVKEFLNDKIGRPFANAVDNFAREVTNPSLASHGLFGIKTEGQVDKDETLHILNNLVILETLASNDRKIAHLSSSGDSAEDMETLMTLQNAQRDLLETLPEGLTSLLPDSNASNFETTVNELITCQLDLLPEDLQTDLTTGIESSEGFIQAVQNTAAQLQKSALRSTGADLKALATEEHFKAEGRAFPLKAACKVANFVRNTLRVGTVAADDLSSYFSTATFTVLNTVLGFLFGKIGTAVSAAIAYLVRGVVFVAAMTIPVLVAGLTIAATTAATIAATAITGAVATAGAALALALSCLPPVSAAIAGYALYRIMKHEKETNAHVQEEATEGSEQDDFTVIQDAQVTTVQTGTDPYDSE